MSKCKFVKAWIGKCKEEVITGEQCCEKHSKIKCAYCGEQALKDCPTTHYGFVCGQSLCESVICNFIHLTLTHGLSCEEIELNGYMLNNEEKKEAYSKMVDMLNKNVKALNMALECKKGCTDEQSLKAIDFISKEIENTLEKIKFIIANEIVINK